MLFAQVVVASLFSSMVMANPIAGISRRTTDCSTTIAGILAANATGVYKAFTLNAENQVAYLGDGQNPLVVQFQECQSLEVGEPHDTAKSGRLYVPSKNQCIGITNQEEAAGPYYTTLVTCGTEYPQRWNVFVNENNAVYWAGDSDEEGTILQGGCGLLKYASHNKGVPTITHSNSQITVECNGTPFRIVTEAS